MKKWESLDLFFSELNRKTTYVVLRNYEEFINGRLSIEHGDIDVLCANRIEFLNIIGSSSRTDNNKDLIHRYVIIDGQKINVDVRYIGDGYYDTKWESEILECRQEYGNLCFVPDEINYYYSLLYHVLIQKHEVTCDYVQMLKDMALELGIDLGKALSLETLQSFMRQREYCFTFPVYSGGIVNFKYVDKSMIRWNLRRMFFRKITKIIRKIKIHIKNRHKLRIFYGRKN